MPGAVFLSYASQDVEAATSICDSLRAAGLEVWFDLSELVGGDAWDAKIKRQIRECAFFLAVISHQTQQRREGYFRLEWRLADERSRSIAHGVPFLFPVVIDQTSEREALVPDSFLAVQWTRLPDGATNPDFVHRIASLLRADGSPPPQKTPAAFPAPLPARRRAAPRILGWSAAAVVLPAVIAAVLWRGHEHAGPPLPTRPASEPNPAGTPAQTKTFPTNPKLKQAWDILNGPDVLPADFPLAEALAQEVLKTNGTDAEAIIVMAYIQDAYLYRGFEISPARRASAQRYAEEGVLLAPNQAYAQGALGIEIYQSSHYMDRAEQVLRQAMKLNPQEPLFARFLTDALFADSKVSSAQYLETAVELARQFPSDALLHYELARHYRDMGRLVDMERELDKAISIEPIANAVVWKARVALWLRGNPDEMIHILNQLSGRSRSLERVAVGHVIYAMATGKVEDGLSALESLPEDWVDDYDFIGPKAVLEATLLDIQGRHELARLRWSDALALLRRHENENPAGRNIDSVAAEIWCLHGLGRDDEARVLLPVFNEAVPRPYRSGFGSSWWYAAIPTNLILGNRTLAIQLIREALAQPVGPGKIVLQRGVDVARDGSVTNYRELLYQDLRLDPRMVQWRNDPEILGLLAPNSTASAKP